MQPSFHQCAPAKTACRETRFPAIACATLYGRFVALSRPVAGGTAIQRRRLAAISHQPSAIICSLGGTVLSRADLLMHAMISGSLGLCFAGEIDAVLFRWQLIVIRQVIGHRADIADERGILGIRHTGRRLLIRRVRRIRSNVAPIRHIRRYWRWPLAGLWSRYATCGGIRQGRRLAGILTRSQRVWRCGRCWPAEGQRHKRLFALFSGFQASLQQQIGAGASGNHTDPDADHPDNRAGTRRRPALRQVLINLLDDLFYLLLNGATIPGRRFAETLEPFFRVFAQRPDRKSTRLNSSHVKISYAVFC